MQRFRMGAQALGQGDGNLDFLREVHQQHETLLELLPEMVVVVADGRCLFINQAGLALLGVESALDRPVWDFVHPNDLPRLMERALSEEVLGTPVRATFVRGDGTPFSVELSGKPVRYAGRHAWLLVVRDVSGQLQTEQMLYRLAYYHTLTGLPNRMFVENHLRFQLVGLQNADGTDQNVALVLIGIDQMKVLFDSVGQVEGERVIQAISGRLRGIMPEGGCLGHLMIDEFAIVVPNASNEVLDSLITQVRLILSAPLRLKQRLVPMSCCIGVSVYPTDASDETMLLRNADLALFVARKSGRNRVYRYENGESQPERPIEELELEQDLRFAVENDELSVVYQPEFEVRTGQMVGVEALLRWQHRGKGAVSPTQFIPIAEESGLIVPIGDWLLERVAAQAKEWHGLRVAVNVSVRQLEVQSFADRVLQILSNYGLDCRCLQVEITETTFVRNNRTVLDNLARLRGQGVRIAIDDFGSGYSSFGYLRDYKVDTLKIDQSFIRTVTHKLSSAAIVSSVITLARALRIDVIAEGVETETEFKFLKDHGCSHVQGFLFAGPEAPHMVDLRLREQSSAGAR